jgi:predicted dehydrogenase/aryl-alcohol dehydrogenase-like predicted oxidoreductase
MVKGSMNWGILGTGNIARSFTLGLRTSRTGRWVAVASRELARAEQFVAMNGPPGVRCHGSYEALLADPEVQAVYISTPHPDHAYWAIAAARAKKHILCEKPIGLNFGEAMAIVESAREEGVFLMEAFMYRCHPQTARLVELIKSGAVGEVRMIQGAFGFSAKFDPRHRLFANDLGGGGILDVGCYPVSMSRLIAGAAMGRDFADPVRNRSSGELDVKGFGHLGKTGVDEYAAAVIRFGGDVIAQVSCGVRLNQENVARIYGSEGHIVVPAPWIPAKEGGETKILLYRNGKTTPEEIVVVGDRNLYAYEADAVAEAIARGAAEASPPCMTWADTLGNMETLDAWRGSFEFTYDAERPQSVPTVTRQPLAARDRHDMPYGSVPGIGGDKKISRLVMGVDNVTFAPVAFLIWDDFFERGGTAFDTAYIYRGGRAERTLGEWLTHRGVRDRVFLLDKGAHTPFCTPDWLTRQHHESLERLRTDHVDLYMMHRDNPDVPVGEFVDVLNVHVSRGTMRAIGASNWTIERIEAFNDYAARHGKARFVAVSNNFSLSRMVEAPWAGCLSSNTPAWRAWHERTGTPLLAWSSQGRGFFVDGMASPEKRDDQELVRMWYSDDNFERLARARELAKRKGTSAINIALAWVLGRRAFETFALVGPRTLGELRGTLGALDLELTPEEIRWLDSGD